MGIETILFAAFTGLKAISSLRAANSQAKAIANNATNEAAALARQGTLEAKEKSKEVRYKAARQVSSFLNSGLTLDGTPQDVLGETFSTGMEDLDNIIRGYDTRIGNTISSANAQSKNVIAQGRNQAINDIVGGFSGMGGGGMFGASSFGLRTGGQGIGSGGITNAINANLGYYGPGF